MRYFLGIDTGSTKSHALVADESGRALGFCQGRRGNPYNFNDYTALLAEITAPAFAQAGVTAAQISGAGLGICGYDWPSQLPEMRRMVETLRLGGPFEIVNDAMIALYGGATQGWGVAVVAGTSCNAWGRAADGRIGRMAGFSSLGENAGASELVHEAIKAVTAEWALRGPKTALSQALVEYARVGSVAELLEVLTTQDHRRVDAGAAPVVFQVAAAGDPVAQRLVEWAGRELGGLALGIVRQLGFAEMKFEVVLGGSFFKGSPVVTEKLAETVHAEAPRAKIVRLSVSPVVGGVLLGMQAAGLDPRAVRAGLIESFERFNLFPHPGPSQPDPKGL